MNSIAERFTGVFTALVTPFRDGRVDTGAFEALVERQIAAGVAGLVPVGTTGEAATLTADEAADLIARTVRIAAGRAFVMAGAGTNSTEPTIAAVRRAEAAGADGILTITPYYNKPSQTGLVQHYSAVAAATDLPVMLYSVPGRTGVQIDASTAAVLAENAPNIIGIKEAGGRVERISELREACGPAFVIHSGDDGLTLPFLSLGATGVTSVVSNYAPAAMVAMLEAWRRGAQADALALHESLGPLFEALFIESNPVPVKTALAETGLMEPGVRAPLAELTPVSREVLLDAMSHFEIEGRHDLTKKHTRAAEPLALNHPPARSTVAKASTKEVETASGKSSAV